MFIAMTTEAMVQLRRSEMFVQASHFAPTELEKYY